MEPRQQRGLEIAARSHLSYRNGAWSVPSQTGNGTRYTVYASHEMSSCTCPDFEERGQKCKHIFAVFYTVERKNSKDGKMTVTETLTVGEVVEKRKNYPRDWVAYNAAATTKKDWFLTLLADLCKDIPQPYRKPTRGTRPMLLSDGIFSACYKVFSGLSARRFTCDLEAAAEAGLISKAVHFNRVLSVLDDESTTPILRELVTKSATPLRAVETEWAIDSSGFSGSRFVKWIEKKYGTPKQETAWCKAHVICGTRTKVIAAAEVLDKDSGDSPRLPSLVATAAKTFTLAEVAADKAYPSIENFAAVDAVGGKLYAAFRANMNGAAGGVYGKMYHLFALNREE